jgi:hypothetical protein
MNIIEKLLVGGYSIKIGKKYISFPKIAPLMTIGILLAGYYQPTGENNIPLFITGLVLIFIGLFGFFYFNIFPSRKPKTDEEVEKFTTFINDNQ